MPLREALNLSVRTIRALCAGWHPRAQPRRRRLWLAVAASIVLSLASAARLDAQRKFDEREIKATYLFNFAQFVEWPAASFPAVNAPLVIGVLGTDPFGSLLETVTKGEKVSDHPLVVARFRQVEDVAACHILFISASEASRLPHVLEVLRGRPVLTVGDSDLFAMRGGMIRFITEQNRVRLRINLNAARAAGMTISSSLLRAAEIVDTSEVR